jgi:PST family polysaccharide transporter
MPIDDDARRGAATDAVRADVEYDPDIDRGAVASGVKWSTVGLVAKQVSRIGFSILLARLLGPENFGIIIQATIYVSFALVLLDVGVGAAIIQQKVINRKLIGTATTLNIAVLGVLVVATLAGAGLWAALFNTPEVAGVLRVLTVAFVLHGIAVVPAALLTRRMDFKRLGIAEVISTIVGGIAGVVAAFAGAEYWALVVQVIVRDAVWLAILVGATGLPIIGWSTEAFRKIFGFSRNVLGSQILNYIGQNADNFLVGLRLGPVALANYALSYRILTLPLQVFGQTANRVVFPVFSRLVDDRARQARYFSAVLSAVSIIVLVPMVIVALAAPEAVPAVFGVEWEDAVRPMQILAVSAVFRIISSVSSAVLLANGRADWVFRLNLVSIPAHLIGFVIGVQWGIDGVAWSFVAIAGPLTVAWLTLTSRLIPFGLSQQTRALVPSVVGALAAVVGWWALDQFGFGSGFALLVLQSVVCVLVGWGVIAVLWRGLSRELVGFARLVLSPSDTKVATQ